MTQRPTAGLVLIGDELLSGTVVDTNGPHLMGRLRAVGARLKRVVMVGDDVDEISQAVAATAAACDLVCTTGGIGPTHDDITIDGVARAFDLPVVEHPAILQWMHSRLGRAPDEAHRRMARVPQGTEIIAPPGTARRGVWPALWVRNVLILPGVPSLMRSSFALVEERFRGAPRWSQALEVAANETALAARLGEVAAAHPEVRVGSYPRREPRDRGGPWIVRLTVEGDAWAAVEATTRDLATALRAWEPRIEPVRLTGEAGREGAGEPEPD